MAKTVYLLSLNINNKIHLGYEDSDLACFTIGIPRVWHDGIYDISHTNHYQNRIVATATMYGSGWKTTWSDYRAVDLAFTTYMLIFTLAIIWLFQARWAYSNTTSYTGAIRYITCPMIAAHIRIGDKRLDYFFLYTNNCICDWKQISVLVSMILSNVLELRTENY